MDEKAATILVVDDTESNRDLLLRRLKRQGYRILSAASGLEAVTVIETKPVDLVLLDIMMPGIDGVEVLQILRKSHSAAELPVIMVTARTEAESIVETLGLGANDYVTKPVDFPILAARLETQLSRKRAEDALRAAHQNLERLVDDRTSELQARNNQLIAEVARRKMLQEELSNQSTFLQATFDHMSDALLIVDNTCVIAGFNENFCQLLSLSPDCIRVGDSNEKLIQFLAERGDLGPGDPTEITARRLEVAWKFEPEILDRQTPDGRFLEIRTNPFPSGGYVAVLSDITERKLAEQSLRMRDRAIDASNSGILITDHQQPNNPIIFANPAFERITGYSEDEVQGRNCRFLTRDDRDQPELETVRKAIAEGRDCQVTLRNYRKDGSLFWNELSLAPVHDNEGTITHFIGIQVDATERKRTEIQLQRVQKLSALGQLTGGIAHDFNNILAVVLGNVQLLERRLDNPRAKKRAQAAVEAAKRGAALTNRLLAFSRGQMVEPSVVIIDDFLKDTFELLRRTVDESVEIVYDVSTDTWPVRTDTSQFENAVLNLVVNARDAINGGGTITIKTVNQPIDQDGARNYPSLEAGDYIAVSVTDTGAGMPRYVIEQAFDPFFTTKETDKGTGLGLSMVYAFATQSGGGVTIDSKIDHGTTICVLLPRWRGEVSAASKSNQFEPSMVEGNESILVVEDNAGVREIAVETIKNLGYRVLAAENGPQALRILDEVSDINLVFSDVVMPGGMDGPTLIAEAIRRRPTLKVLFTTGYNELEVLRNGILANKVDVITKPYDDTDLATRLREILDRKVGSA